MKVEFDSHEAICTVVLETSDEVEMVREDHRDEIECACEEDLEELNHNLRVGGEWSYDLEDLHRFVQKGARLNGLPDWLIIK